MISWPKRLKSRNGRLWARPSRPTEAIGYPFDVGDPALTPTDQIWR